MQSCNMLMCINVRILKLLIPGSVSTACAGDVAVYTEHCKFTYDAASVGDGVWCVATRHAAKY